MMWKATWISCTRSGSLRLHDLWNDLGLSVETLPRLGLSADSSDAVIWRTCQREGLVLITGNRNADVPDSLELVLRGENQSESLPVITLAHPRRIQRERAYAEKTAERILDYPMRIDELRGSGRLYAP
jgi:hypothetical protein